MTLLDTLNVWLDERLSSLARHPDVWGGQESAELQILQLLDVREHAARQSHAVDAPTTFDQYSDFLNRTVDGSASMLATRLEAAGESARWEGCMRAFVASHKASLAAPASKARRGLSYFAAPANTLRAKLEAFLHGYGICTLDAIAIVNNAGIANDDLERPADAYNGEATRCAERMVLDGAVGRLDKTRPWFYPALVRVARDWDVDDVY